MAFAPSHAIGMFFITADTMFDGDITLTTGGKSATLSVADAGADLDDQGIPYFLGIIDDASTFASAGVTTIAGGFFLFNVDDIATATASVPEPGKLLLLTAGRARFLTFRKRS